MSRAWNKEKTESPTRFNPITYQTLDGLFLSTDLLKPHGEQGLILGSYLTCVLRTARIRDHVEIILYGERMKDGKF